MILIKLLFNYSFYTDPAILVKMVVNSVLPTRRRLSTTFVDFMSFVGGLLGLFAGFSFLSAAEVIYHFIILPLMKLLRRGSSTVHPIEATADSFVFKRFLINNFKNSSIHGLGNVGSMSKSVVERYLMHI